MSIHEKNRKSISASPEVYDTKYYQGDNPGFQQFKANKVHPVFIQALDIAGIKNGDKIRILDIGCGRGEIVYISALNGWEALGIDFSESAIALANGLLNNLPENLRHLARFEVEDARKLNYQEYSFDRIFMLSLIEHLTDDEIEMILKQAKAVLKRSGSLIILTNPNKLYMHPVRLIAKLFGIRFKSDRLHINEQSYFSLRKHLKPYFNIQKLWVEKDRNFWFNGAVERGPIIKAISKIVDWGVDNPLCDFLIRKSFLNLFLGTDIWAVVQLKQNS